MLDIQKHKFILVQILKDIYTDRKISSALGFKGGTACYLFYNLPRFSLDLDFDILDEKEEDVAFVNIKKILKNYGDIKEARKKRYTIFFLLSYGEKTSNIKLEISKRKFPYNNYQVKNYLGIPMLVMKREDIFAHKLVALTTRNNIAHRDLFDIWFFLKNNWNINEKTVEFRTGKKFNDYINDCIRKVKSVNERYILQGLGEILSQRQKVWVRENLKKELLFLLQARFGS